MSGVFGTSRPTRVGEAVVHELLHVVNDALFEVCGIGSEQASSGDRLFDRGLVSRSNGVCEVNHEQATQTVRVRSRHRALLFYAWAGPDARAAIRHTLLNDEVSPAEQLTTNDAEIAIERPKNLSTFEASSRLVNGPHD